MNVAQSRAAASYQDEADLAARWAAGLPGPLRLEDGRPLRIVYPGVPGGAAGPDFTGAILDAGGDLLRGDVEVHLLASGWRAHRHHLDVAYAGVVLHLVAGNDSGVRSTLHGSGRAIAVLVASAASQPAFPPPFTPPCSLAAAGGANPASSLQRLGLRRLRIKAARAGAMAQGVGAGQVLYALALEALGGAANREAFGAIARRIPLGALLECMDSSAAGRALTAAAELRAAAATMALRRTGLRPMASPGRRLEMAADLLALWWPRGAEPGWPRCLAAGAQPLGTLAAAIGRGSAIELVINAVLPAALAFGAWREEELEQAWAGLPSPGTYGKLRRLEAWLGGEGERPFSSAARLQGGLLLHAEYCTKGACGRCPLSERLERLR